MKLLPLLIAASFCGRALVCAVEAAAAPPAQASTRDLRELLMGELETYLVLDGRDSLHGKVTLVKNADVTRAQELRIGLVSLQPEAGAWETRLAVTSEQLAAGLPFSIPLRKLRGGLYRMRGSLMAGDGTMLARGEVAVTDPASDGPGTPLVLGVRTAAATTAEPAQGDYLAFVKTTVERLVEHQSARLGGQADGTRFITITRFIARGYRSIAFKRTDGSYQTFWFPELPLDAAPFLADFDMWPILDHLSEITGDRRYGAMTADMAAAFAQHGFHPASGLGFLGEESGFDVVGARGASTRGNVGYKNPGAFKPRNAGAFPQLPLARLWHAAPAQMQRMFRAMYFGLVTDAASMDFDRHCDFDFDDTTRRPVRERRPQDRGFETAGAHLIAWWASCFAQTGDAECLEWARRMADKWQAVQHPQSGLVPHRFGGVPGKAGEPMPVSAWATPGDAALAATFYIEAAAELRKRPAGLPLAEQLTRMAAKLARGIARHAYDPGRRIFRENLSLDGTPYPEQANYCFRTQEEKDLAVKADPLLAQVKVYDGTGLFRHAHFADHCAGSTIPLDLAQVMTATDDDELAAALRLWARDLIAESRALDGAFTPEGTWTFRASGEYIHALVRLWCKTHDGQFLDAARTLADRELAALARTAAPEWWRMPERTALLDGLLDLHAALHPLPVSQKGTKTQ